MAKKVKLIKLPSKFQIGDKVVAEFITSGSTTVLPCTVIAVHFYPGKVKYDLEIVINELEATRVYNVDCVFVTAR